MNDTKYNERLNALVKDGVNACREYRQKRIFLDKPCKGCPIFRRCKSRKGQSVQMIALQVKNNNKRRLLKEIDRL